MAYDLLKGEKVPGDWSMGAPFTTTTEDVDVKLSALLVDTNNLNDDITKRWYPKEKDTPEVKPFVNAWMKWRDETYKFIKSWKSFKIKLAWNYYDNAVERMRELASWRKKWEQLSGKEATGPASVPPGDTGDNGNRLWRWLAIGLGGAAAGLFVLRKLER